MILQLCIVLGALWIGSRYGSLALGAISGIGLAILVFCFQMKPGTPPTDVIYIIIAAVTCAGIMHASGGMDWLIQIAERILRKHPAHITFLAPLCTFFLTVLVGTGHVVYTLMPIICDIALKKGIRPERPCAVASIASQVGITCSPIAAAVVAFVTISNKNGFDITIPQVLMVTIPACLCGLAAASIASYNRGLDLDKDPKFQAKLKDPEQYNFIYGDTATTLDKKIPASAKHAVYIFLGALAVIVMFAVFPELLPTYESGRHDCGSGPDDYLLQGTTQESGIRSGMAIGHGSCCGHLWHCLVGGHLFLQLHAGNSGDARRCGEILSMVHRLGVLLSFGSHQFTRSRGRCHVAFGL